MADVDQAADGPAGIPGEIAGMAAVAFGASGVAAFAPGAFATLLGIDQDEMTPTARLALGLFAARTAPIAGLALAGNRTAIDLFLPVQVLDQIAWWNLHRRGLLGARPTLTAAALSGAIIGFDLKRRSREAAAGR